MQDDHPDPRPTRRERSRRVSPAEAIAIVGIGCRFPGGACDAGRFWSNLCRGVDAIGEIPPQRWDVDRFYHPDRDHPGKSYTRMGGFIDGVELFDAAFFGISGREAERMDPQQRLLLEVAWEALEDGGQAVDRRSPSHGGVFVGISNVDYGKCQTALGEMDAIDMHSGTGSAHSIAANRISYALNLTGPSIAVDTACSSSLVALHLACESLRAGECTFALAAGVNLILNPEVYVGFCRLGMLSPDGRCKAFDASADGFGRGEGVGVVALKPLSSALADGDRIYALVRGSGVNQDGRTPGITAPSGRAQEALIREVHERAGIDPAEVVFFEAHGTGTELGDPIEVNALASALRDGRAADNPLYIGSVKTNIGHLESASGIAGLIKAALAITYRTIPPNIHFRRPNPDIDLAALRIDVPTRPIPLGGAGPLVVSVNSFGFGGTNAHVLLSSAPESQATPTPPSADLAAPAGPPALLCLSARSPRSLDELARRYQASAAGQAWADLDLADIAREAFTRRATIPAAWPSSPTPPPGSPSASTPTSPRSPNPPWSPAGNSSPTSGASRSSSAARARSGGPWAESCSSTSPSSARPSSAATS